MKTNTTRNSLHNVGCFNFWRINFSDVDIKENYDKFPEERKDKSNILQLITFRTSLCIWISDLRIDTELFNARPENPRVSEFLLLFLHICLHLLHLLGCFLFPVYSSNNFSHVLFLFFVH